MAYSYDVDDALCEGRLARYFDRASDPYSESEARAWLVEEESGLLDMPNSAVYVPDVSNEEVVGIMVAELDLLDVPPDVDLVDWTLSHVPAPGTFVNDRMDSISIDDACSEIAERPEDFCIVVE